MQRTFFIILIISILFGCETEEDKIQENAGYFKTENNKYGLSEGVIDGYGKYCGQNECSYNFELSIVSASVEIESLTGLIEGYGNGVFFEFFSPEKYSLSDGTYTYDPDGTYEPYTFINSGYRTDYDYSIAMGFTEYFDSGSVSISFLNNSYKVRFDCYTISNKAVTGSFTGYLMEFQYYEFLPQAGLIGGE
jgi:hypothetical protein